MKTIITIENLTTIDDLENFIQDNQAIVFAVLLNIGAGGRVEIM